MVSDDDVEAIAAEIEAIREATERLRKLGEDNDLPAIERNAVRLQGTLRTLEMEVPPEAFED